MVPQDERHSSYGTRRRPEDARIDWTAPVDDIWRMVRACGAPYPGAWTILNDSKVVIAAAHPVSLSRYRASMPGQIVERTDSSFTVRCGDDGGLLAFNAGETDGTGDGSQFGIVESALPQAV